MVAPRSPPRTRPRSRAYGAVAVTALVLLSAVYGLPRIVSGGAAGTGAPGVPATSAPFPTPIRHVIVVFLENQEAKDVLANGTFERGLAQRYAYANEFYSPMHYSLPNYLAATSGYTSNLFAPVKQANVGGLALAAGRTWGDFQQGIPSNCFLQSGIQSTGYDGFHNPFALYEPFVNNTRICDQHMVGFSAWSSDVAANQVPNYAFVVPNVTFDGHNTSLAVADSWLSQWLSPLLNDSFFRSSAFFITYDEGTSNLGAHGTTGGGRIYLAMVSPFARTGFVSEVNYTTYSLLTTTEWLLGLGSTHTHDNWTRNPPMTDLFSFPQSVAGTVLGPGHLPLPGLTVSDHLGDSAKTNASGGFVLSMPRGNDTIYVSPLSGYKGQLAVTVGATPISGLVLDVKLVP